MDNTLGFCMGMYGSLNAAPQWTDIGNSEVYK